MIDAPKFLQGLFAFEGQGLAAPLPLTPALSYQVPFDKRAQLLYCRAGNSAAELIYLVVQRNGKPMRYFPIGARSSIHVPLAVVEDLTPDATLEVLLAAPEGTAGSLVIDIGLVEI